MDIMEILKKIDTLACEANSLWHKCENLKNRIARANGVSDKQMQDNGIYVVDHNESAEMEKEL